MAVVVVVVVVVVAAAAAVVGVVVGGAAETESSYLRQNPLALLWRWVQTKAQTKAQGLAPYPQCWLYCPPGAHPAGVAARCGCQCPAAATDGVAAAGCRAGPLQSAARQQRRLAAQPTPQKTCHAAP